MAAVTVRRYRTGTAWCLWRWTITPSQYITRLHIIKTPWFAVMLHWIAKPDPEPDLHDHPVTFLSLILRGGYIERMPDGYHVRRWCNFIRAATHVHAIRMVLPGTLTLCLVGPDVREWGYHTPSGWVHWRAYKQTEVRE